MDSNVVTSTRRSIRRAAVIGAGPNGLAAAITLAQTGAHVDVFEAEPQPGGAARTLELTLPGFLHDFGSAVHPLAAGSPFFSSLPLQTHGLDWIHSPAPLAHPFDDGTAVTLERDLRAATSALAPDGNRWLRLMQPFAEHWSALSAEILRPLNVFTSHPFLLARFDQSSVRGSSRAFFPQPRRAAKRCVRHSSRSSRARGRLAHPTRRRAIYHQRTLCSPRLTRRHRRDVHAYRRFVCARKLRRHSL